MTMIFIVHFHTLDTLCFGPFKSNYEATAWADKSIYVVDQRQAYEVIGVIAPRKDHVA